MHLVVDNYDSFTHNIVQAVASLGRECRVVRNDEVTLDDVARLAPRSIVLSPGPGRPEDSGICPELVRTLRGRVPILGVCLGHQCIVSVYGGRIVRARRVVHGKTSRIYHDGASIYRGLGNPFEATRYHSLEVREEDLPGGLEVSAFTAEGEVMGVRARDEFVEGVQFHPESVLTAEGPRLIANFLRLAEEVAS